MARAPRSRKGGFFSSLILLDGAFLCLCGGCGGVGVCVCVCVCVGGGGGGGGCR